MKARVLNRRGRPGGSLFTPAGFGVVELLVVIAVVAILAVLLLPAVSRVTVRAESAGCLVKLRALHVVLAHYASEHNGYLPVVENQVDSNRTWLGYLSDGGYLPPRKKLKTADAEGAFCPGSKVRDEAGRLDPLYANYGMNVRVGGRIRTEARRTSEPRPLQSFQDPSRHMLLADAGAWMLYEQVLTSTGGLPSFYLPGVPVNATIQWPDRFRSDAIEGRHGGFINAVMLDGHAKSIRADRLQVADFWETP